MPRGENESVIVLWIWIGIGLLFLVTLFITILVASYTKSVKKTKQKVIQMVRNAQTECWENAVYLQEKDRERLAEELHDNIISRLNLIRLNTHYKNMNELNLDLKNSMQLIRELSHNLTPPDLSEIALEDLIADYLEQVKMNIHIEYYQLVFHRDNISNSVKLNMFRILQELINNTLKHANASVIKVSLRISKQYLVLSVEDNGNGFTSGKQTTGIGLRNIQLRAKQIGAIYKLKTQPQRGAKFILLSAIKQ